MHLFVKKITAQVLHHGRASTAIFTQINDDGIGGGQQFHVTVGDGATLINTSEASQIKVTDVAVHFFNLPEPRRTFPAFRNGVQPFFQHAFGRVFPGYVGWDRTDAHVLVVVDGLHLFSKCLSERFERCVFVKCTSLHFFVQMFTRLFRYIGEHIMVVHQIIQLMYRLFFKCFVQFCFLCVQQQEGATN